MSGCYIKLSKVVQSSVLMNTSTQGFELPKVKSPQEEEKMKYRVHLDLPCGRQKKPRIL